MASPVTLSSETHWTLEVSVTSASGASITWGYEAAGFETGGLLPNISVPSPPSDARLIVRDSNASKASFLDPRAKTEVVRSLVAAFVVEADPSVCAPVDGRPAIMETAAPLSDREMIGAACTKLGPGNGILARRPIGG
jgi:hypothetical protein